MHYASLADKL